jgi:ArsR family transcriptional regulator
MSNARFQGFRGGKMKNVNYRRRANLLRIIAHPTRIRILKELAGGVRCVSDLEEFLDVRQPTISQHMAVLRNSGLIDFYMDGKMRCYFLRSPIVLDLLEVMDKEYDEELPVPTYREKAGLDSSKLE